MNCPNCGAQIDEVNIKFCEICGTELSLNQEINNSNHKNILKVSSKRKCCC